MKKKKSKGNPYRDPKTGQFASKRPRYRAIPETEMDITGLRNLEATPIPPPKHGWNWMLIASVASALAIWAALGFMSGVL